jgi:glutamyl-tRNA synthetase
MVRVRFAPSPTGYLHVGGARTALFNWLFARHHEGTFILRIEDTDQERSTDESIEQILESMRWLELDWDEYYRQTERHEIHLAAAERLMADGRAYEHEGAWWFRVPTDGKTTVPDMLLGDVVYRNDHLKDFVIRRSDGSFVYNFVVVVDDADMGITHVIRGDDHLNNTPKQILVYEALGAPTPRFVHMPLILGTDRARLSKRHGDTSVLEFRDRGYLPETMVNFLARLGWAHGDQEIFDREELISLFSIDEINKSGAVFELTKLQWLNQQHLKAADLDRLVALVEPFVVRRGRVSAEAWSAAPSERLRVGVDLLRDRVHTLEELGWAMEMLFPVPLEPQDRLEIDEHQADLMRAIADAVEGIEDATPETMETAIRGVLAERGAKLKEVALVCRIAVTGRKAGPGLFDILAPIGGPLVAERLRTAAEGSGA